MSAAGPGQLDASEFLRHSHGRPLATAAAHRGQRLWLESVRKGQLCVVAWAHGLFENVEGRGMMLVMPCE